MGYKSAFESGGFTLKQSQSLVLVSTSKNSGLIESQSQQRPPLKSIGLSLDHKTTKDKSLGPEGALSISLISGQRIMRKKKVE